MSHFNHSAKKWMLALGYLVFLQCLDFGISYFISNKYEVDFFSTWVVITTAGFQLFVLYELL